MSQNRAVIEVEIDNLIDGRHRSIVVAEDGTVTVNLYNRPHVNKALTPEETNELVAKFDVAFRDIPKETVGYGAQGLWRYSVIYSPTPSESKKAIIFGELNLPQNAADIIDAISKMVG